MASTIAADLCRMDPWSLEFVLYHLSKDGLDSARCLDELRALAHMWELEMASVEALHASIRRLQHIVSVQTHGETMQDASAEWLLRRVRMLVRDHRQRGAEGGPAVEGSDAKDGKQPKPLAKKGSGGPWRAFIREATLGCKGTPDFSDLSSWVSGALCRTKGSFSWCRPSCDPSCEAGLGQGWWCLWSFHKGTITSGSSENSKAFGGPDGGRVCPQYMHRRCWITSRRHRYIRISCHGSCCA